jgi:hypothetical protein
MSLQQGSRLYRKPLTPKAPLWLIADECQEHRRCTRCAQQSAAIVGPLDGTETTGNCATEIVRSVEPTKKSEALCYEFNESYVPARRSIRPVHTTSTPPGLDNFTYEMDRWQVNSRC